MTRRPEEFPVVGSVFRYGARDRVLDTLLLLGPLVVLSFVLLGRTALTLALAGGYVLAFVGYVVYKGVR